MTGRWRGAVEQRRQKASGGRRRQSPDRCDRLRPLVVAVEVGAARSTAGPVARARCGVARRSASSCGRSARPRSRQAGARPSAGDGVVAPRHARDAPARRCRRRARSSRPPRAAAPRCAARTPAAPAPRQRSKASCDRGDVAGVDQRARHGRPADGAAGVALARSSSSGPSVTGTPSAASRSPMAATRATGVAPLLGEEGERSGARRRIDAVAEDVDVACRPRPP